MNCDIIVKTMISYPNYDIMVAQDSRWYTSIFLDILVHTTLNFECSILYFRVFCYDWTCMHTSVIHHNFSDFFRISDLSFRLCQNFSDFVRLCPSLSDFVRLCPTLSEMVPKLIKDIISLRNRPWLGSCGPAHVPDDLSGTYLSGDVHWGGI